MTCKDCIHSGLCYKENDYDNFPDRCGDFIGISDNFNSSSFDINSYILGYLSGCENAMKKFNELNSFQYRLHRSYRKENNNE